MTRDEFDRRRAEAAAAEKWQGRVLAAVAVPLGMAQLLIIRLADARIAERARVPLYLSLFLAYIGLVGFLLWRMTHAVNAARPRCPQCKAPLKGLSERMAVTTGKCDQCGAALFT